MFQEAFAFSPQFENDRDLTDREVSRSGRIEEQRLRREAAQSQPHAVDEALICDIHRGWFHSTFPHVAGKIRDQDVYNRNATAVPYLQIRPRLKQTLDNWNYRRDNRPAVSPAERFALIVSDANEITVAAYDIHPFIDGNTRTTFSLRNYLLQIDGLDRLTKLEDPERYEQAWWRARPGDHEMLDVAVALELIAQDARRLDPNRRYAFRDE